MNLWIRVDASSPRDPHIGELAHQLNVKIPHAFGLCTAVWCAMAEHAVDGSLERTNDTTLEEWAGWHGRRGRFAAAFRTLFCDNSTVRGWNNRQGKLIERAKKDRARHKCATETPQRSDGNSTENPRNFAPTERNGTERNEMFVESHPRARVRDDIMPIDPTTDPAIQLATAANQGITERWGEQVSPLRYSSEGGQLLAERVAELTVPLDLARSAIYSACLESKLERPPKTLKYFVPIVETRWEEEQERQRAASSTAPERLAVPTTRQSIAENRTRADIAVLERIANGGA